MKQQYIIIHSTEGHGMAWHGTARHGTAWHGMAWHGMGLHGMAQHSLGYEPRVDIKWGHVGDELSGGRLEVIRQRGASQNLK